MRRSTLLLETALTGGYIGEVPIVPRPIANAMREYFGRPAWPSFTVFYYGDHDAELDELFGYKTHNAKNQGLPKAVPLD